jgi:bis(5'-nucleosidyl)-tetraphosphatase
MQIPKEISAGAVVFHRGEQIEYLLLFSNYWGFPKGHIESGEDDRTAALREVREEAGLEVSILEGFCVADSYTFRRRGQPIEKQAIYFLGESPNRNSRLSHEHNDMIWLPFDQAVARLGYEGGRKILRQANDFILKH